MWLCSKVLNLQDINTASLRAMSVSEQAKVAYLQERIEEAKRSERRGIIISIFGLIIVFLPPIIVKIMWSSPTFLPLLGIIGGLLIIVSGMAISINYAIQGGVLMEQLRRMAQKELGLPYLTMNGKSKF
jgi:hypothetical protein